MRPGGVDEEMVGETSHPKEEQQEDVHEKERRLMANIALAVAEGIRMVKNNPEKNYRIELLIGLGAKPFTGTSNPADAEIWMDKLEMYLKVMECPEDKKVSLATFLLEGAARDWWKFITSRRSDSQVISWNEFKKVFYERYYPRSYRYEKQKEFLNLEQGAMTVAEYQRKYLELFKYASTIIRDEVDKCKRFEDGLRDEIRTRVTGLEWTEFGRLVEAAMRIEKSISERKPPRKQSKREHQHDISISKAGMEYHPRSLYEKQKEFLNLEQGAMTVAEYQRKYIELSKYAANILEDEVDKCKRFEDGLREEIRTHVTTLEWKEFGRLVEAAMRIEKSISETKSEYDTSIGTTSTSNLKQSRNIVSIEGPISEWDEVSLSNDHGYFQCENCCKIHEGQCLKGTNICYNCRKAGHMRRDCPLLM